MEISMLAQVHEMLYIEKGGDNQLKDELNAYNPLIPKGKELVATLMFEIDNPILRAKFLGRLGGVEKNVFIKISIYKYFWFVIFRKIFEYLVYCCVSGSY